MQDGERLIDAHPDQSLGHPIHHAIPFFDSRFDMVIEVSQGYIKPPFILVSLLVRGR
jgi:hypothetical protein